jgi:SPP1 gp7 family putative phage head morphogenesis protein
MLDEGQFQQIIALYNKLKEDNDNLAGVSEIRVESVKATKYRLPVDLPDKQKEFYTDLLDKNWSNLVDMAMELKLTGTTFRQVVWSQENNNFIPVDFISYKNPDLRILNKEIRLYIDDEPKALNQANFILKQRDFPVYQSLLKYYAFYSFALNNWASFTETFGKPIRIGKYTPGTSTSEKNELWKMLQSMGSDLAAMISENTAMEFKESMSKTASSDLYKALATFCEDRETRRILGQTLTTKAEKYGSYSLGQIHDLVRMDILIGDTRDVTNFVSEFISMVHKINFGDESLKIEVFAPKQINKSTQIVVDEKLNNIIEIEPEYFYETYNIPIPKSGASFAEKHENFKDNGKPASLPTNNKPTVILSGVEGQPNGIFKLYNESDSLNSSDLDRIPSNLFKSIMNTKNKLKKMEYSEFKDLKTLADLEYSFGQELAKSAKFAYILGKSKGRRSKSSRRQKNHSITSLMNIDFSWSLEDIEAVNAFRAESFNVAYVESKELLEDLKKDAELAIKNGESFNKWRDKVTLKGFEPSNPYHLKTNFNTAVSNAQLAGQWKQFQEMKEIFPFLRYVSMNNERTRPEHRALHDTIKPINDPFWAIYYPPNDWNCHCSVEQLTAEEVQELGGVSPTPTVMINDDFRKNTGKELCLFGNWLDRKKKNAGFYNYSDLKMKDWKDVDSSKTPSKLDVSELDTVEDALNFAKDYLDDRTIIDTVNNGVYLKKDSVSKFKGKNIKDLKGRFAHLNCVEDTLKSPQEIWIEDKRMRYFKKYDKNIMCIVDINEGKLEYFNLIITKDNKYMNKNRQGVLSYQK